MMLVSVESPWLSQGKPMDRPHFLSMKNILVFIDKKASSPKAAEHMFWNLGESITPEASAHNVGVS